VTLHVDLRSDGSKELRKVQLDVPVAPTSGGNGGRWEWIGPLPKEEVDLGNGFTLKLVVIRTASIADRPRNAAGRASRKPPVEGSKDADPPARNQPEKQACPECGKEMLPNGLAIHRSKKHGVEGGGKRSEHAVTFGEVDGSSKDSTADRLLQVLTLHFQGRSVPLIATKVREPGPVITGWLEAAYKVLDYPLPPAGPDERAKATFDEISDEAKQAFARKALRTAAGA